LYVSSVCLSWPHFVQQNLLPTLTVAACFRGSIFCVESFRLCLFRETYKKLFLVLILFMKYIYIFFLIGTYRLCLYPRGGRGGWFCNLYYDIILSLLFGPEIQKALKIQVWTTVSLHHMLTVIIGSLAQKVVKGWWLLG